MDRLLLNDSGLPKNSLRLSVDNLLWWLSVDDLSPDFSLLHRFRFNILRDISDTLETHTTQQDKGQDDEQETNDEDSSNQITSLGGAFGRQRILHS